ncbi:MAG: hypothetical protein NZ954_08420 [Thermofilaceae archaeon]|nr:hypothetical protein [Thermofilaceae archaeon]
MRAKMATELKRKVIYDIGPRKLELEERDDYTALICTYFPLYPLGNYMKLYITIDKNKLHVYEVRDSWNGTGYFDHGEVELKNEYAEELRTKMKSIQSLDDFAELEKTCDKIIQDEVTRFDELIERLKDKIYKLMNMVLGVEEE